MMEARSDTKGPITLKRGCMKESTRFLLVVLAYHLVIRYVLLLTSTTSVWASILLAIFGYFLLNAVGSAKHRSRELRAIDRAEEGREPEDGEVGACSGEVVARAALLHSPLQGMECVAYEYSIDRPTRDGEGNPSWETDFRGFAHAPCAIRTPRGDVGLLGLSFSDLNDFGKATVPATEAISAAKHYIAHTSFSTEPIKRLKTIREVFRSLSDHPPAAARSDYRRPNAELTEEHSYSEKILPAGRLVTAIGIFSDKNRAIITRETVALKLFADDLGAVRSRLQEERATAWTFALLLLVVSHGIFAMLFLSGRLS